MKERFRTVFDKVFFTPQPLPTGNYQRITTKTDGSPLRLHLRIEKNGLGILIVNASTILHLNGTATEMAYHLIQQTEDEKVIAELIKRYRVDYVTAREDFNNFKARLDSLINTPDLDPETFLDFERVAPHSQELSAPLRLDCALTYQAPDNHGVTYAPANRVKRNLDSEEWKLILEKAWNAGIPHIIFTGGEPTLRPDLPELIQKAEELGQVTGLITDGLRLTEKDYLHQLLLAGLDHMMIVLSPEDSGSWEALKDTLTEDIFVSVHLTLTDKNIDQVSNILDGLAKAGVTSLSISASSEETSKDLPLVQRRCAEMGFSLVWDLPVPYSADNPINKELSEFAEKLEGSGKTWLYLEPDGDVLPAQGVFKQLGNLLTDPWETIWLNANKA